MQHTKGPWRVERGQEIDVVSSSPNLSATVATITARSGSLTAEADARLIAASPALLEACEAVLLVKCGCYSSVEDDWHSKNCLVPKLRAAVAQAKGE